MRVPDDLSAVAWGSTEALYTLVGRTQADCGRLGVAPREQDAPAVAVRLGLGGVSLGRRWLLGERISVDGGLRRCVRIGRMGTGRDGAPRKDGLVPTSWSV